MMWSVFVQGFGLGLAMIVPLGPQNVLVMNQGIRRQYHLMTAGLCLLSDLLLICAGVFGGSTLLATQPALLLVITGVGMAFLGWYGYGAISYAWQGREQSGAMPALKPLNRQRVIMTMLAVTWLNPHVYLDTLVILGSVGGQMEPQARQWFAAGSVGASVVWFYGLALLSARLSPWLNQIRVQRIIQPVVGIIMWLVALKLAMQGWQMPLFQRLL